VLKEHVRVELKRFIEKETGAKPVIDSRYSASIVALDQEYLPREIFDTPFRKRRSNQSHD